MKKTIRILFSLLLALLLLCPVPLSASSYAVFRVGDLTESRPAVSPALALIAESVSLVRSALIREEIVFSPSDFEKAAGVKRVSGVTVLSLPDPTTGTLMLGSLEVMKNQTIRRQDLSRLRYVPASVSPSDVLFYFRVDDSDYVLPCCLRFLSEPNLAPAVSMAGEKVTEITTTRDIAVYGSMQALDPENDTLSFEIVKKPANGLLTVTDRRYGSYIYTPVSGYTGRDSFVYTVTDEYGNCSEEVRVSIRVEKPKTDMVFDDMIGHWAHGAALDVVSCGLMSGRQAGSRMLFDPDTEMTRADFLMLAMQTCGYSIADIPSETVFFDDTDIPDDCRGYVAAAYELGFIRGTTVNGVLCFCPDQILTRAEAAVMLSRMLSLPQPVFSPAYEDDAGIPVWAQSAFRTLSATGILCGVGEGNLAPEAAVTRAQTAQILSAVLSMR